MKAWLESLVMVSVAVFVPIKPILISACALIFFDLATGLLAARKRGEPITSAKLKRTVVKFFLYEFCIMGGYLLEHYMLDHYLPVAKLIAGVVGMTEMKSILENVNTTTGMDIFKTLIDTFSSNNKG